MIILRQKEFSTRKQIKELKSKLPRNYHKLEQVENIISTSLIRDILNDGRNVKSDDGKFWKNRGIEVFVPYLKFDEYDENTNSYLIMYLIDSIYSKNLEASLWYSFDDKKYYIQYYNNSELVPVKNIRTELGKFFEKSAAGLIDEAAKKDWKDSVYNYPRILDLLKEISKLTKSNLS